METSSSTDSTTEESSESLSYFSTFAMPVLHPPPETPPLLELRIDPSDFSLSIASPEIALDVFAIASGLLFYEEDSTNNTASLYLNLYPIDVFKAKNGLPPNTPVTTLIKYKNLDRAKVVEFLDTRVETLSQAALEVAWEHNPNGPQTPAGDQTRTALIENFKTLFLQGKTGMSARGGTQIGATMLNGPDTPLFTLSFFGTTLEPLSPLFYLKLFATLDNSKWKDHPLIKQMDTSFLSSFYLAFQKDDAPLKEREVSIYGLNAELLQTTTTTESGVAQFTEIPTSTLMFFGPENLAFHTTIEVNAETNWSTNNWVYETVNNEIKTSFPNVTIGTPTTPFPFSVGFEIHLKLLRNTFPHNGFPAGVPVTIRKNNNDVAEVEQPLRTNHLGEIHCTLFDVKPGDAFFFHLKSELQDPSINLKRALLPEGRVFGSNTPIEWTSSSDPRSHLAEPSIGKKSASYDALPLPDEITTGIFTLKTWHELSQFLFYMTKAYSPETTPSKHWKGLEDFKIFINHERFSGEGSMAWPVNWVNIDPSSVVVSTLLHEFGHTVMWSTIDISTADLVWDFLAGHYDTSHYQTKVTHKISAFYDGWSDFFSLCFSKNMHEFRQYPYVEGTTYSPPPGTSTSQPGATDAATGLLSDLHSALLPQDIGEEIEGAVTIALFHIYQELVIQIDGASIHSPKFVQREPQGDLFSGIASNNDWIKNRAINDRFFHIIWEPLVALAGEDDNDKNTLTFFTKMKELNPDKWAQIKPILTRYRIGSTL